MPTTLTLSDGVTTVDLNSAAAPGIQLEEIRLPAPVRVVNRVGGHPFVNGRRTVASSLDDGEIEIAAVIRGSTVDDVQSRYRDLVRLLEQANRWEESRTGSPVRLAFKLDGATNTAYRIVTGASAPVPSRAPDWLPSEMAARLLHVRLVLSVEPTWHAGALTQLFSGAFTNVPGSNYVTLATGAGDLVSPIRVKMTKNAATADDWFSARLALLLGVPDVFDQGATADASAYGGSANSIAVSGTVTEVSIDSGTPTTVAAKHRGRLRFLARMKVTAGTAAKVQVRGIISVGGVSQTGSWATFDGASNVYRLIDLGGFDIRSLLDAIEGASRFYLYVQFKTSDASAATVFLDYVELLSTLGFVHLPKWGDNNFMDLDYFLSYDGVQQFGSFVWPRRVPFVYVGYTPTSIPVAFIAERQGQLGLVPPNTTLYLWAAFRGTAHDITHTGTVIVQHLPTYALGLRGAG